MSADGEIDSDGGGGSRTVKFTKSQRTSLAALLSVAGALVAIVNKPATFIASSLDTAVALAFGEEAKQLLNDPSGFVIAVVSGSFEAIFKAALGEERGETAISLIANPFKFIQEVIIQFIANLVLSVATLIIDTILFIMFGSDGQPGVVRVVDGETVRTQAGLLDIPFLISRPIANAIAGFFGLIISQINFFFLRIGFQLEPLGIAAPSVAAGLWVLFSGGILWAGAVVFRSVDIPGINQAAFIESLTAPIRRALDFLFR